MHRALLVANRDVLDLRLLEEFVEHRCVGHRAWVESLEVVGAHGFGIDVEFAAGFDILEDDRLAGKAEPFLAADLRDSAIGREIAAEDDDK